MALFGLVVFGYGEVVGGILHGILIDKIGSRETVKFNILLILIMIFSTIFSIIDLRFNVMTFVTCFLWGYADGALNVFLC
jgi:predicted MFS family arabinose efflux permease